MKEYICPKCSSEFTLGVKFCNKCGCNLEVEFIETPKCPVCGKTFPTGTKFCSEHGSKLVSPKQLIPRCGKCGKQYTDDIKFCPDCGGNVRVFLPDQSLSANDLMPTMTSAASNFAENLSSKFSISVGVLAGTVGVIFFSLFNWIKISLGWGYSIKSTLFNIAGQLNHSNLRQLLGGSAEFTFIRIVSVILVIAMLLSFALLITSLFIKSEKAKPALAYSGFGLCAIVSAIFIVAMIFVSIKVEQLILTVFPFLTLAVAIVAMIFAVKRPSKNEFLDAAYELQQKLNINVLPDYQNQAEFQQNQQLPHAITVLVLGIVSIIFSFIWIVCIPTGIIGIVLSVKSLKLYKQSPDVYSESSHKIVNAGKICSIIGLFLFILIQIISVIFFLNKMM